MDSFGVLGAGLRGDVCLSSAKSESGCLAPFEGIFLTSFGAKSHVKLKKVTFLSSAL